MTIADAGSTNGTVVAGERLHGARHLTEGDLDLGRAHRAGGRAGPRRRRAVVARRRRAAAVQPLAPAGRAATGPAHRGSRSAAGGTESAVPRARGAGAGGRGLIMALVLKQVEYLAFIALSPVMLIGNAVIRTAPGQARVPAARWPTTRQRRRQATADLSRRSPGGAAVPAPRPSRSRLPAADRRRAQPTGCGSAAAATTTSWPCGSAPGWCPGLPASGPPRCAGLDGRMSCATRRSCWPLQECGAIGITGTPAHSRALARAMLLSAGACCTARVRSRSPC